jgi:uncharacterized membrane protein YdjX (TVP38/TMEM64 family)
MKKTTTPRPDNSGPRGKQALKRAILPGVLCLGLASFFLTGANQFVSWQSVALHYTTIETYAAQNLWLSYLIFLTIYTVAVAFSLPIALPLTLTGGAILGWPAAVLVILAATMGAGCVFIAAQSVFADLLRARAGPFLARLEAGFTTNAFSYLLALRLIPAAPFWVVNIVPALTRMKLGPFLLATIIGITPGTTVFVAVGRGLNHILAAGQTPDLAILTSAPVLAPLTALGALAVLPIIYQRFRRHHAARPKEGNEK